MVLPYVPEAVIFDMDGLLFDTETLYQEALGLAALVAGLELTVGIFQQTLGLPWGQTRAVLVSHFGEAFPIDTFQATWIEHFWVTAETRLSLKPGALILLATLEGLG